ncbi:MAG: hypothetical protein R3D28_11170 [Geminicoccaceae bacterium]|jgi:hypothetical protein|nr:hypothetical protein [Geminicoccaceae bacterium]
MIWNLIGTLVLGVAAASVVLVLFRVLGRPAPRWLLPAAAGIAMLGFHIWTDYSWFRRTTAELPGHVVVAQGYPSSNPLQPWTLVVPRIDRFSAVDTNRIRHNPEVPDLAMAVVYLVARWNPTVEANQLYDCRTPRRADVGADMEVDAEGRPVDPVWVALPPDDPVRLAVCRASPGQS